MSDTVQFFGTVALILVGAAIAMTVIMVGSAYLSERLRARGWPTPLDLLDELEEWARRRGRR